MARFDAATFLRDSWQKRPLLIRDPWERWTNPLSPDELAGLACEEGVEARLVETVRGRLKVEHGPFAEARLGRLGKRAWTLLVQAVDHHVPEVAQLLAPFRFVPDWRIDDVMVSCAADGGGVGAHFDHYDVFLVQGQGRRRWQVGQACDAATPLLPHDELRLVADFAPVDEWVLEPGDILYVPPGVAHHGVAVGDGCMTYSIGFRAPSRGELIAHWCDHLLAEAGDDRYSDPNPDAQQNPGEIAAASLNRLHALALERLADRDGFARWFGQYNTERKYPEIDWSPEVPLAAADLREGLVLERNPASRFAFVRHAPDHVTLFVDGRAFDCAGAVASFADRLCAGDRMTIDAALRSGDTTGIVVDLLNAGSLALAE